LNGAVPTHPLRFIQPSALGLAKGHAPLWKCASSLNIANLRGLGLDFVNICDSAWTKKEFLDLDLEF
jgi:hypothetical protein